MMSPPHCTKSSKPSSKVEVPRMPTNSQWRNCRAFTLVEVLVVVAILAVLAALVFPSVGKAKQQAAQAQCINNLKQISIASVQFGTENNGDFPPNVAGTPIFARGLTDYIGPFPRRGAGFKRSPLVCPSQQNGLPNGNWSYRGTYFTANNGHGLSYGQNDKAATVWKKRIAAPSARAMLYMDLENQYLASPVELRRFNRWNTLRERHGKRVNVAFVDGSVSTIDMDEIPSGQSPSVFWDGHE